MSTELLDIFKEKTVLVTGGTGSFGKKFIKFLLDNSKAEKVIVFSRDESKQFHMEKEISDDRIRFFIGDVRDLERLKMAFNGVDIVVHAAALKQIPALEYNPFEAVKTNILGTQNVISAALYEKVEKVLLISTDKAAYPINLYGSTKLCAEKLFISGNSYSDGKTKFSCVRYGNVIGSRGSIVESLLKKPEKVFITDIEMTRFWINMDQAINLVLFALNNMSGGEIFIPKIPSMKLIDLFDAIVPNSEKEITGIRPGEKLHEVLLTKDESRHSVELDKYFVILPEQEQIFDIKVRFANILKISKILEKDFCYSSDNNKEWLSKEDFNKIIGEIKL